MTRLVRFSLYLNSIFDFLMAIQLSLLFFRTLCILVNWNANQKCNFLILFQLGIVCNKKNRYMFHDFSDFG